MSQFPQINVLWLKRDLRLRDHAPLEAAIESGLPLCLLYWYEPSLVEGEKSKYSQRHWRFVWESLEDLQKQLRPYGAEIVVCYAEVESGLEQLSQRYRIRHIFSHQEVGIQQTFDRDKRIARWCKEKGVSWIESPYSAVIRGLSHRKNWREHLFETLETTFARTGTRSPNFAQG